MAKRSRCACPPDSLSTRRAARPVSPETVSARSTGIGSGYIRRARPSSSATRTPGISPESCIIAAIRPAATASRGVRPQTRTSPRSGVVSPSSMPTVVDLPAPFGPSSATTEPGGTVRSMPRTASTVPKRLVTPRSSRAAVAASGVAARERRADGVMGPGSPNHRRPSSASRRHPGTPCRVFPGAVMYSGGSRHLARTVDGVYERDRSRIRTGVRPLCRRTPETSRVFGHAVVRAPGRIRTSDLRFRKPALFR